MRINLKKTPSFSSTYSVEFAQLSGGLNLRDLGYLLENNESPCMKNLSWRNGLLQSRLGQRKVAEIAGDGPVYAVYEDLFHGCAFFHAGSFIYCLQIEQPLTEPYDDAAPIHAHVLSSPVVPPNRGTFFRYQRNLYYKNEGGFFMIEHSEEGEYGEITYPDRFFVGSGPRDTDPFDLYEYLQEVSTSSTAVFKLLSRDQYEQANLNNKTFILRHRSTGYLLTTDIEHFIEAPDVDGEAPGTITLEGSTLGVSTVVFQGKIVDIPWVDPQVSATDTRASGGSRTAAPETNPYLVLYQMPLGGAQPNPLVLAVNYADGSLSFKPYAVSAAVGEFPPPEALWTVPTARSGDNPGVALVSRQNSAFASDPSYIMWQDGNTVEQSPFRCRNVTSEAARTVNAPVIVINASPVNGSGTLYQPENRLSPAKTVWYNGDGTTTTYKLPVDNIDAVNLVQKNGETILPGSGTTANYTVDRLTGAVNFAVAPAAGTNNVAITYSKTNEAALQAILGCKYAATASGGEAAQFLVLGGNAVQPDAIFWNGNDELAIQPWYFPMDCYNLVGTAGDPVTGFGRQYDDTLVFSEHTVGKLTYSIQTIDGRQYPAFGYARVNSKIGCDLPWTIQQVENNVVFCNTYSGAHIVLSSSAAYENNIHELSQKINDDGSASSTEILGLLRDIRESQSDVLGFDDDERYWLCANGKVYVWDYHISTYAKPSWFYWTGISPAGLFRDAQHNIYHAEADGDIQAFLPILEDNGGAITKSYQFPTQHFGTYARLKNVEDLVFSLRSDTASTVSVRYDTDYESRIDLTPLHVTPEIFPNGQNRRYVQVFKRRPGTRHLRQFGLVLSNARRGEDLALVSAQAFYRFTGPER